NDIRAVQRFAGVGLMRSAHTFVMLIVSVAFMLSIDIRLTLWTMVILPMVSVLFVALGREIHRRFDQVQAQFSALSARAQENFSGIREVLLRSEEHTSELQSRENLVCRLLLEKKKKKKK